MRSLSVEAVGDNAVLVLALGALSAHAAILKVAQRMQLIRITLGRRYDGCTDEAAPGLPMLRVASNDFNASRRRGVVAS